MHWRVYALTLQAISRSGLAFSFLRGARVCHIYGRGAVAVTLEILKSTLACKSHSSDGVFFLSGSGGAACWFWWKIYVGGGATCTSVGLGIICCWRQWCLTVMWLAISIGGR